MPDNKEQNDNKVGSGCKYCRSEELLLEKHLLIEGDKILCWENHSNRPMEVEIKFCPMCGRELEDTDGN